MDVIRVSGTVQNEGVSETNILRLAERIPDEAAAYAYLEELRWHGKPVCPHCGNEDRCYFLQPANGKDRATRTGKPKPNEGPSDGHLDPDWVCQRTHRQ